MRGALDLRRAVAAESRVLRSAFAWRARPDIPAGAQAFSYHHNVRPILWALLGASLLEVAVAHLLVALFWEAGPALVVFIASLLGLVWLVGHLRALGQRPLLVATEGVRVRLGLLLDQPLAPGQIADIRCVTDCGDMKREGFLKASLLAYPNTLIELACPMTVGGPLGRRRPISVIALRPDDAAAFVQAVKDTREQIDRVGRWTGGEFSPKLALSLQATEP